MNASAMHTVKVTLPFHLQTLAACGPEVTVDVAAPVTQRRLIAALEQRYPAISGAVVDPASGRRRPLIRFFACQRDLSHDSPDDELPAAVAEGKECFMIVGAIAGG